MSVIVAGAMSLIECSLDPLQPTRTRRKKLRMANRIARLCYDLKMNRVGLICLTLAASAAHATSMLPLDMKGLVTRADRVVLATVISEESHWTPDHDAIYTESVLSIERTYKGKTAGTVVVRREGGSVDGIGMRVFGAARLAPGEEALLFLEQRGGNTWVVGMAQGKWSVTVENGQKVVHAADLSGIAFVQPGQPALTGIHALADVEKQLRALVRK
jgi:hypothetical protein